MVALLVPVIIAAAALPGQAQVVSMKELGPKALQTVVGHLRSDDSDVRALAVEILGETGNKAASGMLRKMLEDQSKYVRIAASRALWQLGSPAGLKAVTGIINDVPAQGPVPVTNNPLVELKIISQNKIREKAIEAYAWMRGEKASELLYKLRNDNYGTVRDAAARELARLGSEPELALFTAALSDPEEPIRFEAASILSRICQPAADSRLAGLAAGDEPVRVRMAALDALACSPGRKAVLPQLLKIADDENPTIRYKAVKALGGIGDNKVRAKLTSVSGESKDIRIRIAAQRGLVRSGFPADVSITRDAISAASPEIRLEAFEVAASFTEEEALPLLALALDDPDTKVKLYGALHILRLSARK